jgi:hypothetical protein
VGTESSLLREILANMFVLCTYLKKNESVLKLLCWCGDIQNIAGWWVKVKLIMLRI